MFLVCCYGTDWEGWNEEVHTADCCGPGFATACPVRTRKHTHTHKPQTHTHTIKYSPCQLVFQNTKTKIHQSHQLALLPNPLSNGLVDGVWFKQVTEPAIIIIIIRAVHFSAMSVRCYQSAQCNISESTALCITTVTTQKPQLWTVAFLTAYCVTAVTVNINTVSWLAITKCVTVNLY